MNRLFLFALLFNVYGAYAQLTNDSLIFHSDNTSELEIHGPVLVEDNYGMINSTYSFDGVDDYIRVTNLPVDTENGYAFSVWVKSKSETYVSDAGIFMLNAYRSDDLSVKSSSYGISVMDNKYEARHRGSDGFLNRVLDTNSLDTLWHHIVGTWDNDSVYLYKDGDKINSGKFAEIEDNITNDLYIGSSIAKYSGFGSDTIVKPFNGLIGNMRLFNKSLSEEEVLFLRYESPVKKDCESTVINHVSVDDTLVITSKEIITSFISSASSENLIKVFPNPTSEYLHIESSLAIYSNAYSMELLDASGALLFEEDLDNASKEISISQYSTKGNLLFLVIKDGTGTAVSTKKILFE